MSTTPLPFQVVYSQDLAHVIDISTYVNSLKTNDEGSGKIRTGTITFNAELGQFITNSNSNLTPIISKFDLLTIIWQDPNANIKFYILSVDQDLKQLEDRAKYLLPLELKGRERALQDVKTTAYYEFKSPKFVINALLDIYSKNHGTNQPEIEAFNFDTSQLTNLAPDTLANSYDFTAGVSIYDAIMEVVRRLNQPTDFGGDGNFYSVTFQDNATQTDVVTINIFVQGTVQGIVTSYPVIQSTDDDPIISITTQDNTPQGTQVFVRGTPNTSTLPTDLHRYSSYIEVINNYPTYNPNATYTNNIKVQYGGSYYSALGNVPTNTPPPNGLFWQPQTAVQLINGLIAAAYAAYDPGKTYPIGSFVSYNNVGYESILFVPVSTPPPNATYWKSLSINYSIWTKQKDVVTKNSCSMPDHPFLTDGMNSPAFPDGNLVIRDRVDSATGEYIFFRDWVICRAIDPQNIVNDSRLKHYLMGTGVSQTTFYKGFTVLVDTALGTPTGAFAANGGKDVNGRFFADAFVQYDGTNWIVTRTPVSSNDPDSKTLQIGDQCAVYAEGRIYEYNKQITDVNQLVYGAQHSTSVYPYKYLGPNAGLSKWQDISGLQGANDCFHRPTNIEVVDGFYPKLVGSLDYSSYVSQSALKITYEFNLAGSIYQAGKTLLDKLYAFTSQVIQGAISGQLNLSYTLTTAEKQLVLLIDYYNYGWWYALPFPYPLCDLNGISESVGELYGGSDVTASEFAVLDLQNANYSHSGFTGLNHNEVSDLGGPLTGIQFIHYFDILYGGAEQNFQGNITFTVTVYDDLRNVWRADYSIRFLSTPQVVQIPFSAFTVDRPSRVPLNMDSVTKNLVDLISPAELEIKSIFEQKHVRLITWQYSAAYDEFLRFSPMNADKFNRSIAGLTTVSYVGIIDGLCLIKQPFVSSGVVVDRVINPDTIDAPNIRNLVQLQSVATAEAQITNLPFESYTVERYGSCDLKLEQSVYLSDPYLINQEDKSLTPNTRKLVLMTDSLSWDQTRGFIRTQILTKRLETS